MSLSPFGSFSPLCTSSNPFAASSLPQCNLFFRALLEVTKPPALEVLFRERDGSVDGESRVGDLNVQRDIRIAGVGIGQSCDLKRMGQDGGLGDIAERYERHLIELLADVHLKPLSPTILVMLLLVTAVIVASAISLISILFLIYRASGRKAAVGRIELRFFLVLFALFLALQIPTIGGILTQGSSAIVVLSSIQVGLVAGMAWVLLANGIVATQIVEDGTLSSLAPMTIMFLIWFGVTTYISLDQAFGISSLFVLKSGTAAVSELRNIALFCLSIIWPAVAVVAYLFFMTYVVYKILEETKPLLWFWLAFFLVAVSLVIFFLTSQPLCKVSNGHLTSAFISTLLATAGVWSLYFAWTSITEANWEDDAYY